MSLGNRLARAATPWEWHARRHVLVLVWASVLVCGVGMGLGWLQGSSGTNRAVLAAANGLVCSLLLVRPAIRSLRRWTAIAAASSGPLTDAA